MKGMIIMEEYKLPLGILRHCIAALDAAKSDIHEVIEDEDIADDDRQDFTYISDILGDMIATIVNRTNREIPEEDFMAEHIDLQLEDYWSDNIEDILDEEIE